MGLSAEALNNERWGAPLRGHPWNTSGLESKWFAARMAADILNIPALSHREHLRGAKDRGVQPLREGGEVFRADTVLGSGITPLADNEASVPGAEG